MTFRNTALLFLIFLLLISCKGLKYYNSGTNPAGMSIILTCPKNYYTNIDSKDSIAFYLVNHNSREVIVPNWSSNLVLIGKSRFYSKEVFMRPKALEQYILTSIIPPKDTTLLIKVSLKSLFGPDSNWFFIPKGKQAKSKSVSGPHRINQKKYYPYIYITAELEVNVPNQEANIKVRSDEVKINIAKYKEQSLKNKKTELAISSDVSTFDTKTKKGSLFCKINNLGDYPIQLFNDPGSVRFKLYAYSPNRTAIMFTQYVLDNGKLPVDKLVINSKTSNTVTIRLNDILFEISPEKPVYFWAWKKKTPPVSPLIYGKKNIGMEVEFWFGIVVDGQEFLSNTLKLGINNSVKK